MNNQIERDTPKPPEPPAKAVVPRTHVNSAMTTPYVPSKDTPARSGADDHKRHTTKGSPT